MVGQRERSPSLGEKIEAAGWPDRRGSEGGAPVMPDLLVTTPFSKEPPDGCDDAGLSCLCFLTNVSSC